MSSENEEQHDENEKRELFGSDNEEISDLEGDLGSDVEQDSDGEKNHEPLENASHTEQGESTTPTRSKLPSFKKRPRSMTEEETAQLEATRREIRQSRDGAEHDNDADADEGQEPLDPQQAVTDMFDKIVAKATSTNKRRRNKMDEEDLERSMDEELSRLRERMDEAANSDDKANEEKKPATKKFLMLEEVAKTLTNKNLYDSILDNQLLDPIRRWLEPLPDRSLPNSDILNDMFDILDKLPIASDHLLESGVGKIVYFYTKTPRIEPPVKKKADQLVAKWSRALIKRKDHYHNTRQEPQEYEQEEVVHSRKRYRREDYENEDDSGQQSAHVRIPQPVAADYSFAPKSTVRLDKVRKSKEGGSLKRINEKMRSIKTGGKRAQSKVSVEGKGLSM